MNIFTLIKTQLEKQTGRRVLGLHDIDDSIDSGDIILQIDSIASTSYANVYEVEGVLSMRVSHEPDWNVTCDLLDLEITGTRTQLRLNMLSHGFYVMSIGYTILVQKDKKLGFIIKEVLYV